MPKPSRGRPVGPCQFSDWAMTSSSHGPFWVDSSGAGLPVDFVNLLTEYETIGSSNTDLSKFGHGRVNILVNGSSIPTDGIFAAMFQVPMGTSALSAIQGKVCWDHEKDLSESMLLWNVQGLDPFPKMWILDACVADVCETRWDFEIQPDSLVIPVTMNHAERVHVLEFFSGGFGGWSSAVQHLREAHQLQAQVLALEYDLPTCHAYALPRKIPIFNGYESMSHDFFANFHEDGVIHGDIVRKDWMPSLATWHPDIICLSAPCPPWSTASKSHGLDSLEGLLFPEAVCAIRFLQPSIVLVENVPGFHLHPHKPLVMRTFAMAGYKLVWSRVVDMKDHAACSRPRWLAMFHRCNDVLVGPMPFQFWPEGFEHSPISRDAILQPPWSEDQQLKINEDIARILSDPRFAPLRSDRGKSSQVVFNNRCFDGSKALPVFMASYGRQHCFSETELSQRGCLAHLYRGVSNARFWHPIEILLIHGLLQPAFVCSDFTQAWKHVGNQIAIPHSLLLLGNAFRMFKPAKFDVAIHTMFDTMNRGFLRAASIVIQELDQGYLIAKSHATFLSATECQNNCDFHRTCGAAFLPAHTWWNLDGFHPVTCASPHELSMSPVTAGPASAPVEPITPTMPFQPVMPATVKSMHFEHQISLAAGLATPDILQVWHQQGSVRHDPPFLTKITLAATDEPQQNACKIICCCIEGQIAIYKLETEGSLFNQVARITLDRSVFDVYGPLNVGQAHLQINTIFDQPIEHGVNPFDTITALAALSLCQITYRYQPQVDVWCIQVHGEHMATSIVIRMLAAIFTTNTLKILARQMELEDHELRFIPIESQCPVPPRIMNHVFAVLFTRTLWDTLVDSSGPHVVLKWNSRALWKGALPLHVTSETLTRLLQHSLSVTSRFAQQRIVCNAKNFASGPLGEMLKPNQGTVVIHIVQECWGGAGNLPAANKTQMKQQIRNSIAGSLLAQNIELNWIHENIDKLLDKVPQKELIPIAALIPGIQKDTRIRQVFADCGISLPKTPEKNLQAPLHMQPKAKRRVSALNLSDYKLDCSCLLTEKGDHTVQLSDFRGGTTGVYITDPQTAMTWVLGNKPISPDELGMVILGPFSGKTDLPTESVVIPCWDRNHQAVLLNATLIQFGSKQLQVRTWEKTDFSATACKVASMTLWKQDWTESEWNAALSQTNKFIRDVFSLQGLQNGIVAFWGRSLRHGRNVATTSTATSMQIHVSIEVDSMPKILSASGYNKIWAAPKQESGRLSDEYRVIWFPSQVDDFQKANAEAAQLQGTMGLVRGKTTFGIRMMKSSFDMAWKQIYPSLPPPKDIPTKFVYKLEPLPFGTNPKTLEEWSALVGWTLRPLKPAGARAWLIGTAQSPPQGALTFNGNLILATLLPPRQSTVFQPIAAGPRTYSKPTTAQVVTAAANMPDPWATYQPITNAKAQAPHTATNHAAAGPTELRFQQQEAKMSEMEAKITEIQAAQQYQAKTCESLAKEMSATESRLQTAMQSSIESVINELTNAFAGALSTQSKQFDAGFQEMKSLLQAASKRKSPTADDEEMDP